MPRKYLIIAAASLSILLAAGGGWIATRKQPSDHTPAPAPRAVQPAPAPASSPAFDKTKFSIDTPGSIWWIVNKKRPLPAGYVPSDLVKPVATLNSQKPASENTLSKQITPSVEQLFQAARVSGFEFMVASGYRSFALQTTYYNNYVKTSGQAAADTFSARPGTSEHQTGLSLDVSSVDRKCYLNTCFGETAAGQWLAAHAHEYGFIVRYPRGKDAITGYQYEPWHIRYLGNDLAAELHRLDQTPEEFFDL